MTDASNLIALLKHHKEKNKITEETYKLTEAKYQNLFRKLAELLNDAHRHGTPIMMHLASAMKEKDHGKKMAELDRLHKIVEVHGHLNRAGRNQDIIEEPMGGGNPY